MSGRSRVSSSTLARIGRQMLCLTAVFCFAALWKGYTSCKVGIATDASLPGLLENVAVELDSFSPEVAWRRLQTNSAGEDCSGTCVDKVDQDGLDSLDSQFLMLDRFITLADPNKPRLQHGQEWLLLVILFGILYMFAALAIVCDEFFVPALEAFVDEFGISMDVAGATFMAAGGSMPELFTSFIATFQESEVGFAAIVGSAVFNVLFVIAVCAISSTEVLTLTWWPLARDCSFYLIALMTVVLVFAINSEGEIEPWEAVLLLCEYICYCTFMKFNGRVYDWVRTKCMSSTPELYDQDDDPLNSVRKSMVAAPTDACFQKPSTFRKGIVQLLTQNAYLYETAGIAAVTQIKGDLEETFAQIDKDGDGTLNTEELKVLLSLLGCKSDSASVKTALRRITRSSEDTITFEAFKKWYIASEARIEIEVRRVFDHFDKNHNGRLDEEEISKCLVSLGHKPDKDEISKLIAEMGAIKTPSSPKGATKSTSLKELRQPEQVPEPPNTDDELGIDDDGEGITCDQFEAWYNSSFLYKQKQAGHELEGDAAEGGALCLDMPDGASKSAMAWFIFTYPLCAMMFCTLPDVRQPKYERNARIAICEFSLSLVWIGIFSNLLYECIVVASNTLSIPPAVAAVTVLAGGTSIPDLLSSYIVARNGEGDMAVSSSIGSNIFDVTVGLPLPWLSFCIAKGKNVVVKSKSLGFSVIVLIVMLLCVITTIMLMKWRMTKHLGYTMLVLYVVFVTQDLLQQLPEGDPVLKIGF